jgi:eukaryotic-like serine/threonine-protein kinase
VVQPQTGNQVFEMGACIGQGGFGQVYKAMMVSAGGLRREVAVKTLLTGPALDRGALSRLRDEARLLAALNHRSILLVHDLVVLEGRLALVSEYVAGEDLAECIQSDAAIPPRATMEVIGEVAGALHAAWSTPAPATNRPMRLIHRDIKPANIRISQAGSVKLLDFGIAKSPELERDAKTGTGLIVGTLGYIAPERFLEEEESLANDIYALGCVLYEALVGQSLFSKTSKSAFARMAVLRDEHDAYLDKKLETLNAPEAIEDLLWTMLAYRPQGRPTAEAVESLCEDIAGELNGPTLRQWCRKRQWRPPETIDGELVGRRLTAETTLTTRVTGVTQRPSTGRTRKTSMVVAGGLTATLLVGAALLVLLVVGALVLSLSGSDSGTQVAAKEPAATPAEDAPNPTATRKIGSNSIISSKPSGRSASKRTSRASSFRRAARSSAAAKPKVAPAAPTVQPVSTPPQPVAGAVVSATGATVQLRAASGTYGPGKVPAGSYKVFANFGSGFTEIDPVIVPSSGALLFRCSTTMLVCRIKVSP